MMSDQQLDDEQAIAGMHSCVPLQSDAWKYILRPVTIFQVLQAETSPFFEDKSLVIEGRGFAAVTLVAHVICVDIQPAKTTYILEDGTGRIRAEKDLSSLAHHHGLSAEVEEEETIQSLAFEHMYVEVTGFPQKRNLNQAPKIYIKSIYPVHGYNQVMYHILNVIHSNRLIQQYIQPYSSDMDFGSNKDMEVDMPVPVDGSQACQDNINTWHHIAHTIPASHAILPNTFSPQKQQPYAALKPLERTIMMHMHYNRNHLVLITEMAQAIQASNGCTESQLDLAIQALLSEAYITSPLDDGYVILTPRQNVIRFVDLTAVTKNKC